MNTLTVAALRQVLSTSVMRSSSSDNCSPFSSPWYSLADAVVDRDLGEDNRVCLPRLSSLVSLVMLPAFDIG